MIVIYDLEVLSNYFLYYDKDIETGEEHTFEVSKFKNELKELIDYLVTVKGQIGFNSLSYDSQIIQYILKNKYRLIKLTNEEISGLIYDQSQRTISRANNNEWPEFRPWDISITQLDLLKVWHYDNEARRCSLKWLQYSMDWYNIEDMPIDHTQGVHDEKTAEEVKSYCKNDIESTLNFYKITKGNTELSLYKNIDKIQLRKDISKEFGFNALNFNDVKIGDEINKINYMNATGLTWQEVKSIEKKGFDRFTFGDCFPSYIKFTTPELISFADKVKNIYIDPSSKQEFKFRFHSTDYTFAKGGLHSNDKPRLIEPKNNECLKDADVGSMYPNAIRKRKLYPRHLGEKWLEGYTSIIQKRLVAKKKYKETGDKSYKSIDEALKYSLNGGSFGKMGEKYNWQYDPFIGYCVTIGCQMELLMLIEMMEVSGIKVVSANTDGIVCLFDKSKEKLYYDVCSKWEDIVGNKDIGQLEFSDYKLLAQTSVNDYIAVKTDNTPKHKGDFVVDFELHKNKSYRVVNLALESFYTKGINPKLFIYEHNNIFDFCRGIRGKGEFYYETRVVIGTNIIAEKLQKTNRYYISNRGKKLFKCSPDGRQWEGDAGKWFCTLYNKHESRNIEEYDINYLFYINKVYDIIMSMQPEITGPDSTQLSFF